MKADPRRSRLAVTAWLIAQALPTRAHAQVNVEKLRADLQNRPLFLSASASLAGRVGNTNSTALGADLFTGMLRGHHLLFLRGQATYETADYEPTVSQSFAHARYGYELSRWLAAEALTQVQTDRFARLTFRWLAGAGPRFTLLHSQDADLHYGVGYLLEREHVDVAPGASDAARSWWHRMNNYLALALRVDEGVRLTNATYFQPRFDEPTDHRLLSESAFSVTFRKVLTAQLTVNLRYDSRPPTEVERLDVEVQNRFGVTF